MNAEPTTRQPFGVLVLSALLALCARAWLAMLALGALHATHPQIPATGYRDTFLALLLLGVVGYSLRRGNG